MIFRSKNSVLIRSNVETQIQLAFRQPSTIIGLGCGPRQTSIWQSLDLLDWQIFSISIFTSLILLTVLLTLKRGNNRRFLRSTSISAFMKLINRLRLNIFPSQLKKSITKHSIHPCSTFSVSVKRKGKDNLSRDLEKQFNVFSKLQGFEKKTSSNGGF